MENYDKIFQLTEIEFKHIEILVLRFQNGGKGWHKQAYIALQRIERKAKKIGRNEPYFCGSNLKFKKCCGI